MRRSEFKPITALAVVGLSIAFGAAACSQRDALIALETREPGVFSSADDPDASADASPIPEDVLMCPVMTCTLPWATCPSSEFPCSSNLLSDDENCGGCGIRCPGIDASVGTNSQWTCVDGKCTFGCYTLGFMNCDGDPTNGCEVNIRADKNHCGDCGNQCPDGWVCEQGACVDLCLKQGLPDTCNGKCTNLSYDDANCGTCGTVCDPTGPDLPALPADMAYGCVGGACGIPKCRVQNKANCNGVLSDGCEVTLHTNDDCSGCGDICPAGKTCLRYSGNAWACLCHDGEALCGTQCMLIDSDPEHCGSCFHACPGLLVPNFEATCSLGTCGGKCREGYADCDELLDNGCEVDTRVNNRNCGACGHACLPGQVCSNGTCLVAPCDAGAGDPTR
jgi:hypothetical protein